MKFSLPGQLNGPECRRVVTHAVALRNRLTPWFASIENSEISELGLAIRIDGSLGSSGPEGVANITLSNGKAECDVVIADMGWTQLHDDKIALILKERVVNAITVCFDQFDIPLDQEDLSATIG